MATPSAKQLIDYYSQQYGLDPRVAETIAMGEGGLKYGSVGDGGHAFGPFQMNDAGGVLTGRAGDHGAYANSAAGIAAAVRGIAKAAGGARGLEGVKRGIYYYERPADKAGSFARARQNFQSVTGGAGVAPSGVPSAQGSGVNLGNSRVGTADLTAGNDQAKKDFLAAMMQQTQYTLSGQQNPNGFANLVALASAARSGQMGADINPSSPTQGTGGGNSVSEANMPAGTPKGFKVIGDSKGINSGFFRKLESALAGIGGTQLKINSGYRSPAHNAAVGGAKNSNHMYGHAVDGTVFVPGKGWIPIGTALAQTAPKYGLRSGTTFLYNGSPDTMHVDDSFNQH